MADSTAGNADTLRQELKKIVMTEILCDGGGSEDRSESDDRRFRVLKSIDDAIRVLNSLKKVESKNPNSDIPSSSSSPQVVVPQEFKCILSNKIMIEPAVIASGETYEKKYIEELLIIVRRCPKSNAVLPNCVMTPNHLVNDLIKIWCQVKKFKRPSKEIVTELSIDGTNALLQRISSSSSVSEQIEISEELRRQTKNFANFRVFFVAQLHDSITRLLKPLSDLNRSIDWNPELHENIISTLFIISVVNENKTVIAQNPLVIPLLTKSSKMGTVHTRRISVSTLWSLSVISSNSLIIANSETLMTLIGRIEEGDEITTTAAASTVYNICIILENREKVVSAGLIPVLTSKIKAGRHVYDLLRILAVISTDIRVIEELEYPGFINNMFCILRRPSRSVNVEKAAEIVYNICNRNRNMDKLNVLMMEEYHYKTFTTLAKEGSDIAVIYAKAILQFFQSY